MPWETIVKPEEKRVFFRVFGKKGPGGRTAPLTKDAEYAEALLAKEDFEQNQGVMLLRFHKDPLAGGMKPQVEPGRQLYRSVTARNPSTWQMEHHEGNIKAGENIMQATPLWVAEWL